MCGLLGVVDAPLSLMAAKEEKTPPEHMTKSCEVAATAGDPELMAIAASRPLQAATPAIIRLTFSPLMLTMLAVLLASVEVLSREVQQPCPTGHEALARVAPRARLERATYCLGGSCSIR
jgi:hypothetical protein